MARDLDARHAGLSNASHCVPHALRKSRKSESVVGPIPAFPRICKLGTLLAHAFSTVKISTKGQDMKYMIVVLGLIAGFVVMSTVEASAVVCARGVNRAGCVAPRAAVGYRSAAVVRRGAVGYRSATVVRRGTVVRCGAAVRR
jgi:hypothetical protein